MAMLFGPWEKTMLVGLRVRKVLAGSVLKIQTKEGMLEGTVKPSCGDFGRGEWYCVEHDMRLKDGDPHSRHLEHLGDHSFVFVCGAHGVEEL